MRLTELTEEQSDVFHSVLGTIWREYGVVENLFPDSERCAGWARELWAEACLDQDLDPDNAFCDITSDVNARVLEMVMIPFLSLVTALIQQITSSTLVSEVQDHLFSIS